MAFPDDRDKYLIRRAEQVEKLATDLCDWLSEFNTSRHELDLLPIDESDVFDVFQLRRLASNLYNSARVPVASAVYGPSQVGKSLFIGQVLIPHSDSYSPLGWDEQHGEPAYYKNLSFDNDLNPQCGAQEATALVTRFTTKDRIGDGVSPEYPVVAKALTRAEWIRVLARGFSGECVTPSHSWDQHHLEGLFEQLNEQHRGAQVDRKWRMDLFDAYTYMRGVDRRGYSAKASILNGMLSRYPLSEEGYVAAAANLFWDDWDSLTGLFTKINTFLTKLAKPVEKAVEAGEFGHVPGIQTHWAGIRFLLDSQRKKVHHSAASKCFSKVEWSDFQLNERGSWYVLEYFPDSGDGDLDQEMLQAAMLELVVPILPDRLNEDWRNVIAQMDLIDVPGMRAGRQGTEAGKRTSADTADEQMEIVKRGKVSYLFERYTEELQIQTLLLLQRGGNLEVPGPMKAHVEMWGKTRYGKAWPAKVKEDPPALFIGMTGIDEEFRNRENYADKGIYNGRLRQLSDALSTVVNDFGGRGKFFTNTYPIRYPGTWDTTEDQRQREDPVKWDHARTAFMESEMVEQYMQNRQQRWEASMRDGDGGLSLISAGFRQVTTAEAKQNQLQSQINEVHNELLQLSRGWAVDPDANVDREKRTRAAKRMIDWLLRDEAAIYYRVNALQEALAFKEGDELVLSDCAEVSHKRHEDPLPKSLRAILKEWGKHAVPQRWKEYCEEHEEGGPWLDADDFSAFVRYFCDFLFTDDVFHELAKRLEPVVNLKINDEAARRRIRRQYVRTILNDYVTNPGPDMSILRGEDEAADENGDEEDFQRFGLMGSFVRRWTNRLPKILAAGGGDHVRIPPGNEELIEILEPFEK
ncbi:MAG: hypothetical protein HQ581_01950 [Planctomycetes bacterium]|nr:hypothetical protein [Planctomycetota bacterium]